MPASDVATFFIPVAFHTGVPWLLSKLGGWAVLAKHDPFTEARAPGDDA